MIYLTRKVMPCMTILFRMVEPLDSCTLLKKHPAIKTNIDMSFWQMIIELFYAFYVTFD